MSDCASRQIFWPSGRTVRNMWNSNIKPGFSLIAMMTIGAVIAGTNAKPPSKIKSGEDVGPNEGTFVVRLLLRGFGAAYECTGAIVGPRHILTAGHCVNGTDSGIVYGGTRNRADHNPIISIVERTYKHPQFGTAYGGYDIGIVKVDKDLDLTGRQTSIPLTDRKIDFNARGTQFGWSQCGNDNQMALKRLNVGFLTEEVCNSDGDKRYPQMLCVDTGSSGSCGGDSGGPVVSSGRLVGVHTLGANNEGEPITSQNVYYYRDWIKSIIG